MIIERFPRNTAGRDFVCGDIHGHFDLLRSQLDSFRFNWTVDRLFCVGDLVDRGPYSIKAVDWIAQPWFHSVLGNHEMVAMGIAAGKHNAEHYARNGGQWLLDLDADQQQAIAKVLATLPFAIEIDTSQGRVGIVHAEIPGTSWDDFIRDFESAPSNNRRRELIEACCWSRDIIDTWEESMAVPPGAGSPILPPAIQDLHMLIVGHSRVRWPTTLANIHYIDTGAYKTGKLTVMQIDGPNT